MKSKKLLSLVLTMLLASTLVPTSVQASTVQSEQVQTVQSEVNFDSSKKIDSRIAITPDKDKDKVIYFTSSPSTVETKTVECEVDGTVTIFDQTSGFIFKLTNIGNEKFKTVYQYGSGFFSLAFYLKPGSTIQTTHSFSKMSYLDPWTSESVDRFVIKYDYKHMTNIINEVNVCVK